MAASGTLQYQMLIRAGLPSGRIASALTAVSVLLFGTVLALPLLSLPAIIGGTPVAKGLAQAAYLGAGLFVLVLIGGVLVFVWDRPLKVCRPGGDLGAQPDAPAPQARRRPGRSAPA